MEFVYKTYIISTADEVWKALTEGDMTEQYFFGRRVHSDWEAGSKVTFFTPSGSLDVEGTLKIVKPEQHLSYSWLHASEKDRKKETVVHFYLKPIENAVRLTLVHEGLNPDDFCDDPDTFYGLNNGWPAILSNMKSLIETGETLTAMNLDD
ncbi:SRPBCC domain-containing protein [Halobacillus yeomjeoni]|uniref:SRPBCC domain-containing protein n=1 Tax=Halobacillus yeomjeoni TaxID=311194 RepID=A0A931HU45_9BACI|nr:SRPBCC domain-containing protein [Halobacillus yeomjeoni]MBH0229476.1 SRPBCC domain-containing protein [Halobacillus yeomjeoni]